MDTRISARECYDRGRTLRESKIYHQALADFQSAAGDPEYAGRAYRELGLCLRAMGRKEEAVAALRFAVKSPSLPEAEYLYVVLLLGQTLEELGQFADALQIYNSIRQQDATFLDVQARIKRLCGVSQGWFGAKAWSTLRSRLAQRLSKA
jgi:tetratricopeptide (TPR) repeat protein